jgi:glycerophosphoryl diester phosphodiesterase
MARYPENTLAAFRAAIDLRSPMIEFDVTLTLDRNVIVSSFERKVIRRIAGMNGEKPLLALLSEDPLDEGLLDVMGRWGGGRDFHR